MYTTIGRNHFIRKYYDSASSFLTGTNNLAFRICGPYANTWLASGTATMANYGINLYNNDYPYSVEKYLYKYTKIRLIFRQVNENATIRICIARRKPMGMAYSSISPTDAWSTAVDQPISPYFNILYQKKIKFDQAVIAGNGVSTTLREEREINLYLPFNRVIVSPTWNAVTSESSWLLGTVDTDHTYLYIDNNDLTFGDGENIKYDIYMEHCFYTLF